MDVCVLCVPKAGQANEGREGTAVWGGHRGCAIELIRVPEVSLREAQNG